MSHQQMLDYRFRWNSLSDACPKCQQLNGGEWMDQDLFQNTLWDMIWGDIWNLDADHTLAHPNCRCQLTVRVLAKPMVSVEETFMRYGREVTAYRDPSTGRFTKP